MILLGNILIGLGDVLELILQTLFWLVIARAILSWVSPDPYNPIVRFIVSATDPFLQPLRKFIPVIGGGLDITPIALIILLQLLRVVLADTLKDYGVELKRTASAQLAPGHLNKLGLNKLGLNKLGSIV